MFAGTDTQTAPMWTETWSSPGSKTRILISASLSTSGKVFRDCAFFREFTRTFQGGDRLCADLSCGRAEDRAAQLADCERTDLVQAQRAGRRVRAHRHLVQDAQPGDASAER